MTQAFCEVENTDPEIHRQWLEKHGFEPGQDGRFPVADFQGKVAVEADGVLANIRTNVSQGNWDALDESPYDDRTFVMVCGGPSLERHLDEIKQKTLSKEYLVVCSNMTAGYLLDKGIVPHVHFILDPQAKKRFDVLRTDPAIQYWLNVGCDPSVFEELKSQGITPKAFLADFDVEGRAIRAVKESNPKSGMMAIQGGSMAGLRAINLADALGFRRMQYYGFDASVEVKDGKARPYAYEKKRGEAIIEIQCDLCPEKFDTTLILQKQVNEFIFWRANMPWMDVEVIGGGLIAHYDSHIRAMKKPVATHRYTEGYKALQHELHDHGNYGVTGAHYTPTIFHAISQLAKKHGEVSVLDYGSSSGNTMKAVREHLWLPPCVSDRCYDPFVSEFAAEPEPADFLICTDVLEHVEPECTHAVLDHIASLTKRIAFFSISLVKAGKVLSDGRNAHINLPGHEWWLKQLKCRFILSEAKVSGDGAVLLAVGQSIEDVKQTMRGMRA